MATKTDMVKKLTTMLNQVSWRLPCERLFLMIDTWIQWSMKYVSSISYSVYEKGGLYEVIVPQRGS